MSNVNAILPARGVRNETEVSTLLNKKFEVSAKMQELRTEIARLNSELAKQGATTDELACW